MSRVTHILAAIAQGDPKATGAAPTVPNRSRAPRPTAPPGWSKRPRPCPAITPARM